VRLGPRSVIALAAAALGVVAAPALGATLVVAAEGDPDSLDPALAYAPESWQVLVNAGEGLVAYRRAAGAAGSDVVPALAARLPVVSGNGRRLSFSLRDNARFGPPANRAVRPSDVKASLERIFLSGSPGRGLYRTIRGANAFERSPTAGGISGITADDANGRLEIALTRSDPAILRVLALPFAFVLPRGTPPSDQSRAALSSAGPYRVAAYRPGEAIELVRNAGYAAGATGPAIGPAEIRVDLGVGGDDALARVAAGTADYAQARPTPAQVRAARSDPSRRVWRHVEGATYYFFMNTRRPPFDDIRVRRAVNLAINRTAMARTFGGEAVPTTQVLPPGVPGRRAKMDPSRRPDLAAARALVTRAGAAGASVSVWGATGDPSPAVTRLLERTLDRIGLRATPRLWERSTMLAALADPDVDSQIGYARWQQDFPDGADWFPLLLSGSAIRTGSNLNYALLDDARVDALIDRASGIWAPAARAAAWKAVGAAVARRAPWAPFANSVRSDITSRRVSDVVGHQLYGFLWMKAAVG